MSTTSPSVLPSRVPIVSAWARVLSVVTSVKPWASRVPATCNCLAVLLSCVAKKRVIALLPMLFVMIIVLVLPLVVRLVLSLKGGAGLDKLSFVDLNYHFGSLFRWCTEFTGGIKGTSNQLEIPTLLMNIFTQKAIDPDIAHTTNSGVLTTINNAVPATVLLIVYGALTVINYVASFAIIRRKDV